jgi:hypothetical protein
LISNRNQSQKVDYAHRQPGGGDGGGRRRKVDIFFIFFISHAFIAAVIYLIYLNFIFTFISSFDFFLFATVATNPVVVTAAGGGEKLIFGFIYFISHAFIAAVIYFINFNFTFTFISSFDLCIYL